MYIKVLSWDAIRPYVCVNFKGEGSIKIKLIWLFGLPDTSLFHSPDYPL